MTEHDAADKPDSTPSRSVHAPRWSDAELDEFLGVHALDAIEDEDERAAVEAYVARSPRARAELESHRHVASAIGNSVVAAPSDLWDRIANKIDDTRLAPSPGPTFPDRSVNDGTASVAKNRARPRGRRTGGLTSLSGAIGGGFSPTSSGSGIARPWAAAAAAAVVFAVASTGMAINRNSALQSATSKNQNLRSDVAIERARSSQLLGQLEELRTTSPVALRLAQLEDDPTARNVELVSANGQALGHILLASDGEGYVVGDTLPTLPIGRTYQLWGVKDGAVLSLGVMGRSPKAMPFAADELWSQLVLTDEASPGVVASKASAAAVATLDQA